MRARGEHCLSGPDESISELIREVSGRMRDPSSFVHYRTWVGPNVEGKHQVEMNFGGANGFGGMDRGIAKATMDNQICMISDLSVEID